MKRQSNVRAGFSWVRVFQSFLGSDRANIAALTALMIIPLTAATGLATEVSNWFLTQRALQNAADVAVLAAAQNAGQTCTDGTSHECGYNPFNGSGSHIITNCATVGTFDCEAVAAASKSGFTDNTNNASIRVRYSDTGCPNSASTCYTVTTYKTIPLVFMGLVGFRGDTTIGTSRAQIITASARASGPTAVGYCMITLDSSSANGTGFTLNGGGGVGNQTNVDLGGCDVFSNGNQKCSGGGANKGFFGIGYGVTALSAAQNCGSHTQSKASTISEASLSWDSLYTNLSSDTTACGTTGGAQYHYIGDTVANAPVRGSYSAPAAANNHLSGAVVLPAVKYVCGDLMLDSNVTVTSASGGSVIVIENGTFQVSDASGNGHSFTAPSTSGVTIVFSGDPGDTHNHYFQSACSSCTDAISYSGPDSTFGSVWQGVAFYQDPRLIDTSGSNDMLYTGNGFQLDITGMFYMPKANVTIKGAVNHPTDGYACIGFITNDLTVSGGGSIFPNPTSQCPQFGVTLPPSPDKSRPAFIA